MHTIISNRQRQTQWPHRLNEQQEENINNGSRKIPLILSPQSKVKLLRKNKNIMTSAELEGSTSAYTLRKSLVTHLLQEDKHEHFREEDGTNKKDVNNDQALILQNSCSSQEKITESYRHTKLNYEEHNETFVDVTNATEFGTVVIPDRPCNSLNSSDKMSLHQTLQHLPSPILVHPRRKVYPPLALSHQNTFSDTSLDHGILDFVNDDIKKISARFLKISKPNSIISRKRPSSSDPTVSPAQCAIRSLEKSPRRKRSKSESKRRRGRKLIAAGEMEVRQANESLMHYMNNALDNDTSLSGELEMDRNIEDSRVYTKINSHRIKKCLTSNIYTNSGLSSILKQLSDNNFQPESKEIYNPFTPVTSPTDNASGHVDKMFVQTSHGYRPIEHSCYCKYCLMKVSGFGKRKLDINNQSDNNSTKKGELFGIGSSISGIGVRKGRSENRRRHDVLANFGKLTNSDCHGYNIKNNIGLACLTQKIWLLVTNICHGLLAGLGLAQLIFLLSGNYTYWSQLLSLIGEIFGASEKSQLQTHKSQYQKQPVLGTPNINMSLYINKDFTFSLGYKADVTVFVNIYMNTFYCLGVICMVSVLDRMDICRWSFRDTSELVSFRWLITFMIHVAVIIFAICSYSLDKKVYFVHYLNITAISKILVMETILSWSIICLSRCVSAICGWCIIGIVQQKGFLYDYLIHLTSYHIRDN